MEQSGCTDTDNPPVSSPQLTLPESVGTILLTTKQGYWNHYMFHRWLLGYKSVIPEKLQQVYIPRDGMISGIEFNKLVGHCRELARYYSGQEQERIWKWVRNHETYTRRTSNNR